MDLGLGRFRHLALDDLLRQALDLDDTRRARAVRASRPALGPQRQTSAASGYVCPVDYSAEPLVVGVVVAPDDVPADHAGLLLVAGVVGAVQGEVPQCGELRLDAV